MDACRIRLDYVRACYEVVNTPLVLSEYEQDIDQRVARDDREQGVYNKTQQHVSDEPAILTAGYLFDVNPLRLLTDRLPIPRQQNNLNYGNCSRPYQSK